MAAEGTGTSVAQGVFAHTADWHITDQVGGGSAAIDAPIPTSVDELQAEVKRLRYELEKERTVAKLTSPVRPRVRAFSEDSDGVPPAPELAAALVHQSSTLPDGSTVLISEAELAGMRKLFDMFDTNGDGHIEVSNLVVRGRRFFSRRFRSTTRRHNAVPAGPAPEAWRACV